MSANSSDGTVSKLPREHNKPTVSTATFLLGI